MPCGQYDSGRLVHTCTSVTSPIAPDCTHSTALRPSSHEWPWLPICVTAFGVCRALRASLRASSTDQVQRLLHVDVLVEIERGHRDRRVHVIGRRDDDRIDVLLLFEHQAIVGIALLLRQILGQDAA